jgi:hypothetical protein
MTERSFVKAVKRAADKVEVEPIVFDLTTFEEDPEGEPLDNGHGGPLVDENGKQVIGRIVRQTVLHASPPSDDAQLLSMVQGGRSDATTADRVAVVYDLFKMTLPPAEYRILMARLRDPEDEVTTEMLTEIFEWLQEEWADFPTQSPSGSSPRQHSTGKSSTGRSRSRA